MPPYSAYREWIRQTQTASSCRCYDGYPKYVAGRRVLNIGELQCDPNATSNASTAAGKIASLEVAGNPRLIDR